MTDINTSTVSETASLTDIDAALAKAKSAKPGRVAKPAKVATESTEAPATPTEPKTKRPVKSEEEKAAELQARKDAAAARKAEKAVVREGKLKELEAVKAEKKAARAAKKEARLAGLANRTPHLAKVEKAAARLPSISEAEQGLIDAVIALGAENASKVIARIEHSLREVQTKASLGRKLTVGQVVTITSGPAAYLGATGTVVKVQRIRCLVEVPGHTKPAYVFTADCTPVTGEASIEATESTAVAV
jgi:hypothetical protein